MAQLLDRVLELPIKLRDSLNSMGKVETYMELPHEHRRKMVAKVVPLGDDRTEVTVRTVNLQRTLDSAQMSRARGRRVATDERDLDNIARAQQRARKAVRHLCQLHKVDRMLTLGTRATLEDSVLLARVQRFTRAYGLAVGRKLHYVAVPEPHADGVHLHVHMGVRGWFDLSVALPMWHALCAADDASHVVNGSINVKTFEVRAANEDVSSIIAGYIAKYAGKSLEAAFNKKKYWATRVERDETQFHLLEAETPQEAMEEVCAKFGVLMQTVLLTHDGCFFPLLEERGFWIKLIPQMERHYPF